MIAVMHNNKQKAHEHNKIVAIPLVGAYPSRKEWEQACWQKLLHSKGWLNRFITPYERRNLVLRATAAYRLHTGASYKNIGSELWLAPQTISTIKKGISEKRYRSYAERGKTERKKKVYSVSGSSRPHRKLGIPHKTKYGTIYL